MHNGQDHCAGGDRAAGGEAGRSFSLRYWLTYSILFTVIFFAAFFPFFINGKSFVGMGDGESQYILHLRYTGQWIRESVSALFHGGVQPGRYDFTIGTGDDIGAVVRFHPLDLLAAFVPASRTEALYNVLTYLRSYLAGLSFSLYAFFFHRKAQAVLTGAVVYVFCGFTFFLGIVHPTYMSAMILLPLLFLGAEKMMDPERRHSFLLLSLSVCLGFVSNYYFMYISSAGLLAYVLLRFPRLYRKQRGKNFLRLLAQMAGAYLLGLLLAAAVLFPTLSRYLTSMRASHESERSSLLFYSDRRRYAAWFLNLITPYAASGNGTHLNFAVTLFPALVILFSGNRKKRSSQAYAMAAPGHEYAAKEYATAAKTYGTAASEHSAAVQGEDPGDDGRAELKGGAILCLVCLLVPACGYVLAAMNNENNRWVYLISFAAAATVTFMADRMLRMNRRQRILLLMLTVLFDAAAAAWCVLGGFSLYHAAAALELTVLSTALILISRRAERSGSIRGAQMFLIAYTALSAALGGILAFGSSFADLTRFYQDSGTTLTHYSENEYTIFESVPEYTGKKNGVWEKGFYRVDGVRTATEEDNSALYLSYPGIQAYNSILNADVIRMMNGQESAGMTSILHFRSLDGRTAASALAGVRYFAADSDNSASVPYGYSDIPLAEEKGWSLYENEHPLSFGFTVDETISRMQYEAMDAAEKEQVLLTCAVAESMDGSSSEGRSPAASAQKAADAGYMEETAALTPDEGVTAQGEIYTAGEKGGSIRLRWESREGCETYLRLSSLNLEAGGKISASVRIRTDGIRKDILLSERTSSYSRNMEEYLVKLDNGSGGTHSLGIYLPAGVSIRLAKASVVHIPLDGYEEKIDALNEDTLHNVVFEGSSVSGSITLPRAKYMVLQIPYSRGWSATVNGKKVKPDRADVCWLGLRLEEGTSEIRLQYRTPGLDSGIFASLAALAVLFAALAGWRKQKSGHGRRGI